MRVEKNYCTLTPRINTSAFSMVGEGEVAVIPINTLLLLNILVFYSSFFCLLTVSVLYIYTLIVYTVV